MTYGGRNVEYTPHQVSVGEARYLIENDIYSDIDH